MWHRRIIWNSQTQGVDHRGIASSSGLAILLPVVPFALEMVSLRRLSAAAFGTLMSLEPAFVQLIGFVLLHQVPSLLAVAGIGCVVVAGVGAVRGGGRKEAVIRIEPPAPERTYLSSP